MSLINDALKQARKAPPRNTPSSALPPLQPIADESSPVLAWLVPAFVILLIVAAIFFIGWAVAHHSVRTIVTAPDSPASQPTTPINLPAATPPPVVEAPPPATLPDGPKLQGIFYSPTAPSAILDGKTIRPGDQFRQYRVKQITKFAVLLVGPDGKTVKIGMDN